jgi:hypothetical protein
MSAIVDNKEDDNEDGGEESCAVEGRPPVAPEWLRGDSVSKEWLRRV